MTVSRRDVLAAILALPALSQATLPKPPPIRREFRGAWIATVANIDWPSQPGLSTAAQKAEMIALLDRAKSLNLNAILFQVRPACDALYASEKEPWSEYLTGTMGRAPAPFYDPLAFAVEEAHRRGLELHAWFNPYRARKEGVKSAAATNHLSQARPDLVKKYGRQLWCDPGEPEVQQHALEVILDVARRYDIDGVHIDDYFYPYREKTPRTGREIPFPDEPSWKKYVDSGGTLLRDDWRRANVDGFVERLYREIKAVKPWVKLGISPFGIGRPGNPPQIKGFDPYEQLYADSGKWLNAGWCDYFSPQLYWRIEQRAQSFPVLLAWWITQNPTGRHVWPGSFTSRVSEGAWPKTEIEYQIRTARGMAGAGGTVHFSIKALMRGSLEEPKTLAGHLRATVYDEPALVPASPWLGGAPPAAPQIAAEKGMVTFLPMGERPSLWAVQSRTGERWTTWILPGEKSEWTPPPRADAVAVTAIDRVGNASSAAVVTIDR